MIDLTFEFCDLNLLIAIDNSRSNKLQRTGTENYSYRIIQGLCKQAKAHTIKLYDRQNIRWPRLWTQMGLAWELIKNPPDILFVPAHTLPFLAKILRPKIKMVVTIHDLGYEYLPQYHQWPQRIYLNWSTVLACKVADRIIAVSAATKKDLINKLHVAPQKIEVIYEGA